MIAYELTDERARRLGVVARGDVRGRRPVILFAGTAAMDRESLERELADAEAVAFATLERLINFPHGSAESTELDHQYDAARHLAANLRRQLAEQTGDEHAVWLDLGVRPEAAVSGALLVQTEYKCYLLFNASVSTVDGRVPQAIVEFVRPEKTQFGLPNDEALEGHPLSSAGLTAYDAFEVINSRWLAEEERRNQKQFPDYKFKCRHFIFTFHDSSFECLAGDLRVTVDSRPFEQIWREFFPKVNGL